MYVSFVTDKITGSLIDQDRHARNTFLILVESRSTAMLIAWDLKVKGGTNVVPVYRLLLVTTSILTGPDTVDNLPGMTIEQQQGVIRRFGYQSPLLSM